jgi:hypothetical protein
VLGCAVCAILKRGAAMLRPYKEDRNRHRFDGG